MQSRSGRWNTTLLGVVVVLFTAALVMYPKESLEAGNVGLRLFWDTVFPSLLPFFILSELMLGLGLVRGLGVLLEPLMRPLFSVPGVGAFALSMGLAAGYPMDAVITARFRRTGMCTQVEGERLLAFTNTADPLFMFGAVAVGMFKSPTLGALLAVSHYISAFLVGVLFKLWGRKSKPTEAPTTELTVKPRGSILVRAYREMLSARLEDGRPFGKMLGNSVTESIQTLLMICAFIVFFAVLIEVLNISGVLKVVGAPIAWIYQMFGIHHSLVFPTLAGLLEIDVGTSQAALAAAPMLQKVALASAIIAWSGLSVHAQVASVLTETDIRMAPYILARFLHAALAAILTVVLWGLGLGVPLTRAFAPVMPVFTTFEAAASGRPWWNVMWSSVSAWGWILLIMIALGVLWTIIRRVRVIVFRARLNQN